MIDAKKLWAENKNTIYISFITLVVCTSLFFYSGIFHVTNPIGKAISDMFGRWSIYFFFVFPGMIAGAITYVVYKNMKRAIITTILTDILWSIWFIIMLILSFRIV